MSSFKLALNGTPENANPTIFDRSELPYAVNPALSSIQTSIWPAHELAAPSHPLSSSFLSFTQQYLSLSWLKLLCLINHQNLFHNLFSIMTFARIIILNADICST